MPERSNIEDLIIRYLLHDISDDELYELNTWILDNKENKSYFFQLKNIYDSFRYDKIQKEDEIEKSWNRMNNKIQRGQKQTKFPLPEKKVILMFTRYTAIILIGVLIGWGIKSNAKTENTQELSNLIYNEIKVEKNGKPNTLILSDGSKISMNSATNIRYPISFSKEKREIFLDGEAYFEIAEDIDKPFIIHLKQQDIKVLGTNFNVEAYKNAPYSIVTLASGSIALEMFNEDGEHISQMLLKPNQKAYYDYIKGAISLESIDASHSKAWIKGEFKFQDEPLFLITKRLENYYGVKIHIENDDLKTIKYTGTLSFNQEIQNVLKIINYDNQFLFTKDENGIFITKNSMLN